MLRALLAVTVWVLLVVPVRAQSAEDAVGVGTRVRVFLSPDALPPRGAVFTGHLAAVGDTLVIGTDGGSTIRVAPSDLSGFDVYAGRRSYPYWVPAVGGAVGFAGGYLVGRALSTFEVCSPIGTTCREYYDEAKTRVITGVGLTVGALLGAYSGRVLAAERWDRRSVRALPTGDGVALSIRL